MESIYQSCFDLIHTYIYGSAVLTSDMNLICTLCATAACLFCFAIPFVVVYKVIGFVCNLGTNF